MEKAQQQPPSSEPISGDGGRSSSRVPSLSRRGVLALALEQLSFELDEDKFQALAAACAGLVAQKDTEVTTASGGAAAAGGSSISGDAAAPATNAATDGSSPSGGILVRDTTELAEVFLELLLGEEKFFP